MAKIFISYRREDSQHQADRLHAALARKIPKRNIFIDVDNIPVGVNFVQHLDQQVAQCDVLLALIGPDWLEMKNPQTGQRRLDDPKDFVRIEIAAALKRGIPVAPVLLDGAPFPPEHRLPEDLKGLTLRNGVEVRRLSFDADTERLVRGLNLGRAPAAAKPAPSRPASAPRSTDAPSAWIGPVIALGLIALGGGAWAWFGNPGDWRGLQTTADTADLPSSDAPLLQSAAADPAPAAPLENATAAPLPVSDVAATPPSVKPPAVTALDDEYSVKAGAAFSFNPESNDGPSVQKPLKVVAIDGKAVGAGQLVTLAGAHRVRLNATSLQFTAGNAAGQVNFYYTVQGKDGGTAEALVTVRVTAASPGTGDVALNTNGVGRDIVAPGASVAGDVPARRAGETFRDCAECPQLVSIPAGTFMMGSPASEADRSDDEGPQRRVTIPAFAAGKFEVTVGEYLACVSASQCSQPEWRAPGSEYNISTGTDDYYKKLGAALTAAGNPIVGISWNDAKKYVAWLNSKVSGSHYRLLSEAEWEYAARAGSSARWSFGDAEGSLGTHAWYSANSGETTHAVGTKAANAFGLHDMHGNVWEWVEDCFEGSYSAGQPSDGRAYTSGSCSNRVIRGGSGHNDPQILRSAYRERFTPLIRQGNIGFRVARTF